jgi:transposase
LPIVNRIIERMRLEEFLEAYLPREDRRTKVPAARALVVLLRNILLSREPIYGIGEWASGFAPDLLGLTWEQLLALNDDRVGRSLVRLFRCRFGSLTLAVACHSVREFAVGLDQLNNDSTTVSFFGAYRDAAEEKTKDGLATLAITFGHSKDRRPDLKQLLYTLTVSADGAVPIHFTAGSGNVTDDTTHRATWDFLCELTGRRDFLYVADCKLAARKNLRYIAGEGGRFISVLPRTRKEDGAFRQRLLHEAVRWKHLFDKTDVDGRLVDRLTVCDEPTTTAEGFRLFWYHSTRKAELDATSRADRIERTLAELSRLRHKLRSPRTRYREKTKVQASVEKILRRHKASRWLLIEIEEEPAITYRQEKRGRPGKDTRYVRHERIRFDLRFEVHPTHVADARALDGVFPLVTNVDDMSDRQVLEAYKKQPLVEKRFSQLKTDFQVAPVFLKDVSRIQALLCVYFFALLVEALLERELRQAMRRETIDSLPLYPEGRPCRRPTARRVIDLFANVQRHTLSTAGRSPTVFVTNLSPVQRQILKLLKVPLTNYGR